MASVDLLSNALETVDVCTGDTSSVTVLAVAADEVEEVAVGGSGVRAFFVAGRSEL